MIDLGIESYPNNVTIVEAVSAAEIDAGFVNHYYALELGRDNPDLKSVNHFIGGGDVGALVNVAGVGILKTSTNQEPARRFVEFLLSKEIQVEFTRETFEYPLTEGVAANEKLTPLDQLDSPDIDLSNLDDLEGTLDLLEDLELL
jgi:iron(III) transport system substrate-binding protein